MKAGVIFFWFWIANLGAALFICFSALWVIVTTDTISMNPKWLALGYVPPFWFIIFLIPPVLIYLFLQRHKLALGLVFIYLGLYLGFGDLSFIKPPVFKIAKGQPSQKISVVALNLRYYSFGFEEIVEAINQMDADIYLLSENRISEQQIVEMKRSVSPKVFYMGQQESTAIISKYPVIAFNEISFPTRQASLHKGNKLEKIHLNPFRSFAHAVINVNGTSVHAISVRFIAGRSRNKSFKSVMNWGFYVLDAQQKEIEFFLAYLKNLEGPVIFGGDLNATPSSRVVRELTTVSTDLYLHDHIWGGFTFGTSFPPMTNFPAARLDYIFGMNQLEPSYSEKLNIVVSDHYPVLAEVLIPLIPE